MTNEEGAIVRHALLRAFYNLSQRRGVKRVLLFGDKPDQERAVAILARGFEGIGDHFYGAGPEVQPDGEHFIWRGITWRLIVGVKHLPVVNLSNVLPRSREVTPAVARRIGAELIQLADDAEVRHEPR